MNKVKRSIVFEDEVRNLRSLYGRLINDRSSSNSTLGYAVKDSMDLGRSVRDLYSKEKSTGEIDVEGRRNIVRDAQYDLVALYTTLDRADELDGKLTVIEDEDLAF